MVQGRGRREEEIGTREENRREEQTGSREVEG